MRNKTPFISRSRECTACLVALIGAVIDHRGSPAFWLHLDTKLMWGRGTGVSEFSPGETVTSSELLQSVYSGIGSTDPETVLDSKYPWHFPEKTSDHR